MAREKDNWVTDKTLSFVTGSYLNAMQYTLVLLKNLMVNVGGWRVVASKGAGAKYEYEGVTGGGTYSGYSTGPYDVWEGITDVVRAANGSGPGWVMLEGPEGPTGRYWALIASEGTSDSGSNAYFAISNMKFAEPVTNYLPTPASGAKRIYRSRFTCFLMYSGTFTHRLFFTTCPDDGSFALTVRNTARTYQTSIIMFSVLQTDSSTPGVMPVVIGEDTSGSGGLFSSQYQTYWTGDYGSGWPFGSPSYWVSGGMSWGWPLREATTYLFDTDFAPNNFEGVVQLLPLYLFISDDPGEENFVGLAGRVPDFWVGSSLLTDGDVMTNGLGAIEYIKCGYYIYIPSDTTYP